MLTYNDVTYTNSSQLLPIFVANNQLAIIVKILT